MVRAMILEPGKQAEVRFICPKKIGELVGGIPEITEPYKGMAIAVNEEGKVKGLPLNRSLLDDNGDLVDIYAGTMVILGCKPDGELLSITDEQVVAMLAEFGEPETPDDWLEGDETFTREDIHALLDALIEKLFS